MRFISPWITTPDFLSLPILNVFRRQYDSVEIPPSAFQNYHAAFRRHFSAKHKKTYTLRISADDAYKLYINGQFVGQGVKQGYADSYSYNVFDITPYIEDSENVIVVHAYYSGRITRAYQTGDNRFGIVADILENGAYLCGTDAEWKYARPLEYVDGDVWGSSTGFYENIDFRLEEKGWREKNFNDSAWPYAVINADDDHIFREKPTKPLYVGRVAPSSLQKMSKGHYIIDFGKEITGQFYMEMTGKEGQIVTVLCGEELNPDGSVRYDMRARCKYEETCTLSGKKDVFLFFEYKGFRYVELITAEDNFSPETFAAIFRHYPFQNRLRLETDNEMLQKLWKLFEHSVICGAQEHVVDCPTREKGQYVGDFALSGMAHLYLTGDRDYFREIMQDFADSCKVCPGMLAIAPGSLMQEIADTSLEFPAIVYNYFVHTGDKEGAAQFMPACQNVLTHFSQFVRSDGLLDGVSDKWNLVDWPSDYRDNYDFPLVQPPVDKGCHNVINALYIGALMCYNTLCEALSMPVDTQTVETAKASFTNVFYDPERKLFRDAEGSSHYSLHANVLPGYFGFQPSEATASLIDFLDKKGIACGVRFAYYLLKSLVRMGAHDEAFRLLMNEGECGWVNMLREGATATFEAWGKEQTGKSVSLCHAWGASPIMLLYDDFNGKYGIKITRQ
ncbi:MAG: family 78 glycoside hydrolase catalytic domain [Clostridia bacterium]|nr:family 78 glycoside hydrolase catalytic domain [Clostridia bacterium]